MFGVMFHHFHDDNAHKRSQGSLDAAQLDALITRLKQNYTLLDAPVWQARALRQQLQPGDVCLTFDDALRCQWDIALPVLQAHQITAFWFVYTCVLQGELHPLEVYRQFRHTAYPAMADFYADFQQALTDMLGDMPPYAPVDYLTDYPFYTLGDRQFRYWRDELLTPSQYGHLMQQLMLKKWVTPASSDLWLTADHVKALHQQGHIIGMHSHTHPTNMDALPVAEQQAEYHQNIVILTDLLGTRPLAMAHPSDRYSADTLAMLTHMGVRMGFSAHLDSSGHMLTMPRVDHTALTVLPLSGLMQTAP
jgi:peptidoglycan/xylan/chitin deacetylase (PgdA/CDA1 family)